MIGFFKHKQDTAPVLPDAVALLEELNAIEARRPKPGLLERFGPYAKDDETDAVATAGVYLAYERYQDACKVLSEALDKPEELARMQWLPGGVDYARTILRRMEAIAATS